jgi:ankyrin repeat protein
MRRIVLFLMLWILAGCRTRPGTPLTEASAGGDLEQVRALLAAGAKADHQASSGYTALMGAARAGQIEVIEALLEAGADPDIHDTAVNAWTALIHAIHKGQNDAALLLMNRGADVNAKGRHGLTALMMAAGYGNAEMVRALLAHGADPSAEMPGGLSALSNAVGGAWDIDSPGLRCDTAAATVKHLLAKAPGLKLKNNFWDRVALLTARVKGCSDVIAMVR